jgi:hypothetical protein
MIVQALHDGVLFLKKTPISMYYFCNLFKYNYILKEVTKYTSTPSPPRLPTTGHTFSERIYTSSSCVRFRSHPNIAHMIALLFMRWLRTQCIAAEEMGPMKIT